MLVVINDHINDADDEISGLGDMLGIDPTQLPLDPEQIALSDVLEVAHSDEGEFVPELEAETPSRVTINWELPEVGCIAIISSYLTLFAGNKY